MTPERTSEGKRVLYLVATGQRFERWPVDAADMLQSGAYTADPSLCQMAAATVSPAPEPVPVPEVDTRLASMQTEDNAAAHERGMIARVIGTPLPTEHSPGVPLVISAENTEPAKPFVAPTGQTSRGRGRGK